MSPEETEIARLRGLLWVNVLCCCCGHRFQYNRADDLNGEKADAEHHATCDVANKRKAVNVN